MELRRTRAADLPRLHDIFTRAIAGVYRPHAFEPPAPPLEVFANQQRHLLDCDGERCWVVELAGEPVAFASAWARDDAWFLASLFVDPDLQHRGVGSSLLRRVWGDGQRRRMTITDAIQPVSNALYARRGLLPITPVLSFGGTARHEDGTELEAQASDPDVLRRLDDRAYGFDRSVDHAYWARIARCTVWVRGDTPVAYSYVFPDGTIGPVCGRDGASAAAALAAELARADGHVRVRIPGSSRRLVATAIAAGLRLAPVPGLLLVAGDAAPPDALAIASYTLF